MSIKTLPTSHEVYLEVEGRKVAVVQSYQAQTLRNSRSVEAFGEKEPIATIHGQTQHALLLHRLYATDEAIADNINFYELENFSLSIVKPDRRITYEGCRWDKFQESATVGDTILEQVSIIARERREIKENEQ